MCAPTVLLVDDDEDSRIAMKDAMEAEGYTVEVAENGAVALERLKSSAPPALVLLDLRMPVMDGPAFYRAMLTDASVPTVDVVVLSALSENALPEAKGFECPVLRKPIDLLALLEVVASHTKRPAETRSP